MTAADASKNLTATPCLCEFSSHPFDDCYCCSVTGRSTHNIATYCMDRYWECPIYQKHKQESMEKEDAEEQT